MKLGIRVRDTITGFAGIATARSEQLYGPNRICIEGPVDKEGKAVSALWFDAPRVEAITSEKPQAGFRASVLLDPAEADR